VASGCGSIRAVDGSSPYPPPDCRNKVNRYYFQLSIGLPPGALYVSPIDLNIERGVIKVPWKPMLRMAMPAGDLRGPTAGIAIVNIAADELIAGAGRAASSESEPLQ
jgi:two-component system, NtrC family, sensor kinase